MFFKKRIYLDYASITPEAREVRKEMNRSARYFANPSSLYKEGVMAQNRLDQARRTTASFLNASKDEIIFTSGGTEANNLAFFGAFEKAKANIARPHMVVASIEHSSVIECVKRLELLGAEVTWINPDKEGVINPKDIRDALKKETFLVSVQLANNEIGVIQPITAIAKAIRHFKKHILGVNGFDLAHPYPLLHTDACQAFNYLEIDVLKLHVDLLTLDGSKVYGPRGVGLLFKRRGVDSSPLLFGGGQEDGLRSGTQPLSLILGFTKALSISFSLRDKESKRLRLIQHYFFEKLEKEFPESSINGSKEIRLPNNINFFLPGLDSEFAVLQFDAYGIAISNASSCLNKNEVSMSYVVKALGKTDNAHISSLRVSFGRETKKSDIDYFLKTLKKVVTLNLFATKP